ncbi:hypothetical protein [Ruegeria sp. EL01]|uniref:hypothetical protein n=1 Tax=Ruegeria sp. EL01 TaxID=2107578 RepID=UPI000EA81BFE|nr:hypothetical protein [Ruegeria sp. EL01]
MSSLIETIRKEIADEDLSPVKLAQFERELVAVATRDSLGAQIESAINARKQGRMNDAISQITRANRTQLDAIERIMDKLDKLFERPPSKVMFARYRQTIPFEMGVENAADVIDLVQAVHQHGLFEITSNIEKLHCLEVARAEEAEALEFFENRFRSGGAELEIVQAQEVIGSITEELIDVKSAILGAVIPVVIAMLTEHGIRRNKSPAIYEISGWLYQIITSKTRTKPAESVKVD